MLSRSQLSEVYERSAVQRSWCNPLMLEEGLGTHQGDQLGLGPERQHKSRHHARQVGQQVRQARWQDQHRLHRQILRPHPGSAYLVAWFFWPHARPLPHCALTNLSLSLRCASGREKTIGTQSVWQCIRCGRNHNNNVCPLTGRHCWTQPSLFWRGAA